MMGPTRFYLVLFSPFLNYYTSDKYAILLLTCVKTYQYAQSFFSLKVKIHVTYEYEPRLSQTNSIKKKIELNNKACFVKSM